MGGSEAKGFKNSDQLVIYCNSTFAGRLKRTATGCEFHYDEGYIENSSLGGIAFHMKKKTTPYKYYGDNLPPFFAGLLPEGLRLKSVVKKIKTSEDDLFSILAAIGSKCVGDVYVKNEKGDDVDQSIAEIKSTDFYKLFQNNIDGESFHGKDESFAGVQEKISASMVSFPLRIAKKNKFYILKLNPKDKPRLVENESCSLMLAKKCGLTVNSAKIVEDKNKQKGLLVERFDRFVNEKNKIQMLHQEDSCQFLNRYPADKYRLTFQEICKGVDQYATAPKIEILKLMQLYAFSYLIGNGDLHGKNISLQVLNPSRKVVLTPCYDLLTTYIHKDRKMALKMNGRDDNIKRKDFINLGESFSIPLKSVELMLNKLLKSINKHHELMFEFMDKKEQDLWVSMFRKRCDDLG